MRPRKKPFAITRNNYPIDEYTLSNSFNPGIQYDQKYLEFSACVAAGLDLEKWYKNKYDNNLIALTIAWYQGNNYIKNNVEDAREKKAEQQRKRANRR